MSDINALVQAFQPAAGANASTVSISATSSSSNVALPATNGSTPAAQFMVWNSSTSYFVFLAFGPSSVAATAPNGSTPGSFPLAPQGLSGAATVITVPGNPAYVAAICPGGTSTVYICPGTGSGA